MIVLLLGVAKYCPLTFLFTLFFLPVMKTVNLGDKVKGENCIARGEWGHQSAVGTCPGVSKDSRGLSSQ